MALTERLLVENIVFFTIATGFLIAAGWAWRSVKPFQLPQPLPHWFRYWFGSVQLLGTVPPLGALGWMLWQGDREGATVLGAYFIVLALQGVTESLALRRFHSVAWVMVPYLYVPYRLWQLYEGMQLTAGHQGAWIQLLLVGEICVWGINYLLDLAQLPFLFRWSGTEPEA